MYSREISSPPEKLIKNGIPVFGTFSGITPTLDIKGVANPFHGIPMPPIFTRFRIRARLIYVFNFGDYIGSIEIFDNKILNMAELIFWNKTTCKKYRYRKFLGVRYRFIPKNLDKGICSYSTKNHHIRFSWNHLNDRLSIILKLKGDFSQPEIDISFLNHFADSTSNEIISVKPAPNKHRCSATWYAIGKFCGSLNITNKKTKVKDFTQGANGIGLMFLNRSYYSFITKGENISAVGKVGDKEIIFRLSTTSLDGANTDAYNDNVLFVDGELTLLPPTYFTHPFGINKEWIIQDVESMVDLTFTPSSVSSNSLNLIGIRTASDTIFGMINGFLLTKENEKIMLKEFPAIVKKSLLRL